MLALQVDGKAAQAGMGTVATKVARLQAAADHRKKARPPPQPAQLAQLDPLAKRQVLLLFILDQSYGHGQSAELWFGDAKQAVRTGSPWPDVS